MYAKYMFNRIKKKLFKPEDEIENQMKAFLAMPSSLRFPQGMMGRMFIRGENTSVTRFDAHYVYHPAWACRKIIKTETPKHIDISSTLQFCSMLSAFLPVEFYDYRPANLTLSNLKTGKADLLNLQFEDNSIASLSCMHTVEHVGLGRYGDPLDPDGDLKAMTELKRVLQPAGNLFFVVPVGQPKIFFNAHRIYSYDMIIEAFKDLSLLEFALIDDANCFHSPGDPNIVKDQKYGCGCFWFQKPV